MQKHKVGITGCTGRIGRALCNRFLSGDNTFFTLTALYSRSVVDAIGTSHEQSSNIICTDDFNDLITACDVIIDFTRPVSSLLLLEACANSRKKIAVVCGTTGFSAAEMEKISEYANMIPIFYSANMSLGVSILSDIARTAIAAFHRNCVDVDVSILEKHHKMKADKPSGTAKMLKSDILATNMVEKIEVASLRYGKIAGDHDVIISTNTEVLTLSHHVMNRGVFANGAITAAEYILKQIPGKIYNMSDMPIQ